MTKRTRDSLFFIFIGVFLFLTILISLYASGYTINLRWPLSFNRLLQKTGMLNVDTNPSGAFIYLNNKPAENFSFKPWENNYLRTPSKIRNLAPGDYTLRLEQEGYWPFEKTIRILPGQTTFAEEINLFRDNLPLLVLPTATEKMTISPNNRYLFLPAEATIITLKDNQAEKLALNKAPLDWQWTDDGNRLLTTGVLFDLIKKTPQDYQARVGSSTDLWHKSNADGRLYYRYNNSLNRLEADGQTSTVILSGEQYLAYQVSGDQLFFITEQAGRKILQSYSLKNKTLGRKLVLPASGEYRFPDDNPQFLSLYDQKNLTLYLINPEFVDQVKKVIPEVIGWQWVNSRQLIYHNRWEIYWLNIDQSQSNLINRLAEEITQILWNSANNYLIFATPTNLGTIDLKNGYLTTIFKAKKIGTAALDQKNDALYFTAQIGQQSGVYKLLLQ